MELHPGERILYAGHPSWRSILGFYLKGLLIGVLIGVIVALAVSLGVGIGVYIGLVLVTVLVGYVMRRGTEYVITNQRLHIRRGLLSKRIQQTRLERVQNVNTNQSLLQRVLRVGTVDFDTAGTEDADFTFVGVSNPAGVVHAVDRAQREAPVAIETPPDEL
jgi:uncharacterized membrane protein YdbT with pleckstrin-like domain